MFIDGIDSEQNTLKGCTTVWTCSWILV